MSNYKKCYGTGRFGSNGELLCPVCSRTPDWQLRFNSWMDAHDNFLGGIDSGIITHLRSFIGSEIENAREDEKQKTVRQAVKELTQVSEENPS